MAEGVKSPLLTACTDGRSIPGMLGEPIPSTRERPELTVVGTGIVCVAHTTPQARDAIAAADKVLYYVVDDESEAWIRGLNGSAESLAALYNVSGAFVDRYVAMAAEAVAWLRRGADVCLAFYGHPGVLVLPASLAVARARAEGFPARLLPGISAEDCLFADLGVDPGFVGCQSFEATDFLVYRRQFDPSSLLILWQIGALGRTRPEDPPDDRALQLVVDRLRPRYGVRHEILLYVAASDAAGGHQAARLPLGALPHAEVHPVATLCVPPGVRRRPDRRALARLGADSDVLWKERLAELVGAQARATSSSSASST